MLKKFCLSVLVTALLNTGVAAQIPFATDAPKPLTPKESLASFQLPDNLRIELVASEPLIVEPSAMVFDEFGQLFVGELHGYNLEGYYDILELNETGELDREIRRVRVEGPALDRARNETVGVIKLLWDEDGDGHFESGQEWATNLPPVYGLIRARDGLVVVSPPQILYLADLDGDGRAEVRETLYEGFGFEVIERGINSPRRGADNWIYVATGGGGGKITGPNLAEPVQLGQTDFRIRDDGSAIEAVTGSSYTFGMALTDFGDRFVTSTNNHALYATPLEYRHLIRNPFVASPRGIADAADYDQVFPTSEPDPWRLARNDDPRWVEFYGQRETMPNGYFTSACGPAIYRGGTLPEAYLNHHFACDPANNLIHRSVLSRVGAGYTVARAVGEESSEFLTSTDRWFRPINIETGPDGTLYITDFYREIIEDYSAIPRHLQQRYVNSLRAGFEHGRIWRVTAKNAPAFQPTDLVEASIEELVQALENANPWMRETAQRNIITRGGSDGLELLRTLVSLSNYPTARLHALYTLDGLGMLEPADIERALVDDSYGVRLHALRLAEPWLDQSDRVRNRAVAMAGDSDPAVRLQAAQSLGASSHPEVVNALASLASNFGSERWMSAAITSSSSSRPEVLLEILLTDSDPSPAVSEVVTPLATTLATQGNEDKIEHLLDLASNLEGDVAPALQIALLDGLVKGMRNNASIAPASRYRNEGLVRMLTVTNPNIRKFALQLAGLLRLDDSPAMQRAWDEARNTALDRSLGVETRIASVSLLSTAPWERKAPLGKLLDPREPLELQLAAVEVFSDADSIELSAVLLDPFETLSPDTQEAILNTLFMREDRLGLVLDAVENGVIPRAAIPPIRQLQLRESGSPSIRERAKVLLEAEDEDGRADVIARFQEARALPRNPKHGQEIFVERCSICHKLRGVGKSLGPDLSAVQSRPDETLLSDILDPSSVITPGFAAYLLSTEDGALFTGTLAEETATSITLHGPDGETETFLRNTIEDMRISPISLMPDGLEEGLMPQDIADLLGYLRDEGGAFVRPSVVVFEDNPDFLDALTIGVGSLELSTENAFSGSASLRVDSPQRWRRRIEGWRYRIVESPSITPDSALVEIRYLRLAWRTDGNGIMIELADDGRWPSADSGVRRYFSGQNQSGRQAYSLSDSAPKDWTVITVDLWKDFGGFTLTSIAPTAVDGPAYFDHIEFLASIDAVLPSTDAVSVTVDGSEK